MPALRRFAPMLLVLLAPAPAHAGPVPGYLRDLATVTNGAGEPIALGDLKGKIVVLDVWASWCAPCVAALPELQSIGREWRARGVRIVPVSIDRDGAIAAVRAYARQDIRSLPLYVGPPAEISRRFGIRGLPFTTVYDATGRVVANFRGTRSWTSSALRRAIAQAVAAKQGREDKIGARVYP